jgi:predicted transcriptional regulator
VRFRLARAIAERGACGELIAQLAASRIAAPEARRRCRRALASYVAGALLMPYDAFWAAARQRRHDLELLALQFNVSFEQVCHRLTTLRRPLQEGVPVHFLRVDIAGNISKRFGGSGLRLPRYGGTCPRWAIHAAFLTPGRVAAQVARMPDGQTFLFVARTTATAAPHGEPCTHHAVMIGCEIGNAGAFVYADGLDLAAHAVPVGVTCSQCPRTNCRQRAFEQAVVASF